MTIPQALKAFQEGRLVGIPTETVYGLAAPIDQPHLIKKIFSLKGRPLSSPLIVHVSSLSMAQRCALQWDGLLDSLAQAFWPGPLALITPKNPHLISDLISAQKSTVAIRMPQHRKALELIEALGCPVVAPSANKYGAASPTKAQHVRESFLPEDVFVLDGGDCTLGIESTILGIHQDRPHLARPGPLLPEDLAKALGERTWGTFKGGIVPGSPSSHYRPTFPLYLVQDCVPRKEGEVRSLPTCPKRAAHELYSLLREPLPPEHKVCYLQVPPESRSHPSWVAIENRITKAATEDLR